MSPLEPEEPAEKIEVIRELWTRIIDGIGNEWPSGVAVLSSGDVVVAGTSFPGGRVPGELLIAAYRENGTRRWEDRRTATRGGWLFNLSWDVAEHPDGGVVVLASTTLGSDIGSWIVHYDRDGALLWEAELPHARGYSLTIDRSGTAFVAGETFAAGAESRALLLRANSHGELDVLLDEPAAQGVHAVFGDVGIDAQDRLVVTRWESDRTRTKSERAELRRYQHDGRPDFSSALDCGGLLAVASNGVIFTARGGELAGQPIILCRYDAEGRLASKVEEERPNSSYIGLEDLVADDEGRPILAGFAYRSDREDATEMFVRRYARDGTVSWDESFGGPTGNFAYGKAVGAKHDRIAYAGITTNEGGDYAIAVRLLENQITTAD